MNKIIFIALCSIFVIAGVFIFSQKPQKPVKISCVPPIAIPMGKYEKVIINGSINDSGLGLVISERNYESIKQKFKEIK